MPKNKRLTKSERKQIIAARRELRNTSAPESVKNLRRISR